MSALKFDRGENRMDEERRRRKDDGSIGGGVGEEVVPLMHASMYDRVSAME